MGNLGSTSMRIKAVELGGAEQALNGRRPFSGAL
jgi:hypothetical protein